MKLCVFTVMLPDLSPQVAVREMHALGYDGVEWRVKHVPAELKGESPSFWGNNHCTFEPTVEAAKEAKALSLSAELETPTIGTYIGLGDIEAVQAAITFAKTLGSPQFRVGLGNYAGDYLGHFAKAKAFLTEVVALAKENDLKALLEIHHRTIVPSASLMYRLVSHFDPAHLGVIHDAGNMVHEGFEDYGLGVELLGDYLAHVHVKNALFGEPQEGVSRAQWSGVEAGVVDFAALFKALKSAGYDGWLGVEDFSQSKPSREALQHNFEVITDMWTRA